MAMQANLADGV